MEVWGGPAIVAALVSALVSAPGWLVTAWQAQRLDQRRRDETVHDFQIVLHAEIHGDLLNMVVARRAAFRKEIATHPASNVVFECIAGQIHVLSAAVIAPVIHYARLRQTTHLLSSPENIAALPSMTTNHGSAIHAPA